MSAGTAYTKRYGAGFVDLPTKTTPVDQQFLNAVEIALLQLIGSAPTADGQVAQWDNANTRFGPALLLNKNIDPAAGIVKSKLDFTGANGIVDADVAGAAAIAQSKISGLAASLAAAALPAGSIIQYGAAAAPTGWVLCDGSSLLRSAFTALFAAISTAYGSADGTHFNVPDLRGRVPVGLGSHADVSALANSDGQVVANRRPKHRTTNNLTLPNHTHTAGAFSPGINTNGYVSFTADGAANASSLTTGNPSSLPAIDGSVGTNVANDALDTPSYIVVNYIIKT